MSKPQALLACAAIGACVVIGTLAAAYSRQNDIRVYFDNGLEKHVKVTVGGESFNLSYGAPMERRMKPGPYEVVIADDEKEIERYPIEIAKKDLMAALMDPEFYVYNIGEIHIYRRATIGYAVSESDRSYSEQIYSFQHFFSQPGADFIFSEAPKEITTESKKVLRDEFTIAKDLDYNAIANMRFDEGNIVDATKAIDKALELDPCSVDAFKTRIALMLMEGPTPGATAASRSFRETCDDAGVEVHRAYQDMMNLLDGREAVIADYRARQRRDPSAENDYLLGRLVSGEESLALYRSALTKNEDFARARLALAYDLMSLERYDEALAEIELTLDKNYLVSDAASLYGYAAVGASQYEKAEQRLAPLSNLSYYDANIWNARFVTTLARQDWNAIERLLMEYRSQAGDEAWSERIQYLELRGDPDQLRLHLGQALARPELGSDPVLHKFQQLYARGEYENAAATIDELPESADDLHRLYAAVGLALAGKRAESRVQLATLGAELKERGDHAEAVFFREAVALLEGGGSEKGTIAAAREAGFLMLPHAYFLLGAQKQLSGNVAAAKPYFQRSVKTAVSFQFPYVAAQTLATN